jgi:predicted lipoprotein with Yx(FWY)xxD motif
MSSSGSGRARILIASAALALVAGGCGGEDSEDGAAAGGSGSSGSLVSVASVDGTDVLVDADGHTLYSADAESGGQILCVDACTSFWEPVTASAADVRATSAPLKDELGVVDRPDGESQLTYDGMPLYTFAQEGAGELQGDGFADDFQGTHFVWSAARTDLPADQSGEPSSDTPTPDVPGGGGY